MLQESTFYLDESMEFQSKIYICDDYSLNKRSTSEKVQEEIAINKESSITHEQRTPKKAGKRLKNTKVI